MIALVGDDGFRPVVWGLGATLEEARADAWAVGEDAVPVLDLDSLDEYEISETQAAIVRAGDVSWPIVLPVESDETRDCLGLAVHGRTPDNET